MIDLNLAVRALQYVILGTALVGALASTYVMSDYVGDLLNIEHDGNYRMTAAIGNRTSAMLAGVLVLLLIFAIFAILGPLPPPGREMRALISNSIFAAITFTLTALKLLNLRDRVRLRRK